MMKLVLVVLVSMLPMSLAQASDYQVNKDNGLLIDEQGKEARYFGVNYNIPFAYGYRSVARKGLDHKAVIDMDIDHIARLGLDAYRVHIWDREISDKQGNLLVNEHLDLLDYTLARLKQHNIKIVLTALAWWGSGYPEPDPEEPGFSTLFSKAEMNQKKAAIAAQHKYLQQLVSHVNPYTGVAYKDDPDVIAFELFNEPKHLTSAEKSGRYVTNLIDIVRKAGVNKPLFYNISEQGNDQAFGKALCDTSIDGIAYQWYPTGLVKNSRLNTNLLPAVSRYTDVFADIASCQSKAKMVYEFDAADSQSSTMLPAMARSFRGAGFQWATYFAYDSGALADSNSEYNTHYLNLLYTPKKAISLMIANKVFKSLPRFVDLGRYPNNEFANTKIDYHQDLSIYNTATDFIYTGTTHEQPKNVAKLTQIAGVGNSPVVRYAGNGAYFLDKLSEGIWQLEVYPDVIKLEDPHQPASFNRKVASLVNANHSITINLPDLGESFYLKPMANPDATVQAKSHRVNVSSGKYLLTRKAELDNDIFTGLDTNFYLPENDDKPLNLWHQPRRSYSLAEPLRFNVTISGEETVDEVSMAVRYIGHRDFTLVSMKHVANRDYSVVLDSGKQWSKSGAIEYGFVVNQSGHKTTYPGATSGSPMEREFVAGESWWSAELHSANAPVSIYHASLDRNNLIYPKGAFSRWDFTSGEHGRGLALRLSIDGKDIHKNTALVRTSLATDNVLKDKKLDHVNTLVVKARAVNQSETINIGLLDQHGLAYGRDITIGQHWNYYLVPLSSLTPVDTLLTQSYPMFMPARFAASEAKLNLQKLNLLQGLQFSMADVDADGSDKLWHIIDIEEVSLVQR